MNSVLALARPEIRELKAYEHAAWDPAFERLHANELPWRGIADPSVAGLNRYPEPQPRALVAHLAGLYGVPTECVLVGRGSDEGIDLVVRAFCRAGEDAVLITPPTFGMYAVAARIQGARVVTVPLRRDAEFALDADGVMARLAEGVKIVFLCTPNNPTGNQPDPAAIDRVIAAAAGRALVVVDEAYVEFAPTGSLVDRIATQPHVVVLRTLSKAHALAGARVGTLIARPEIVALLRKIIPPYAMAQPTIEATCQALEAPQLAVTRARIAAIVAERMRVAASLATLQNVLRIFPSAANFLLVEFRDADRACAAVRGAHLLVRDFRSQAGLEQTLRITIGTPEQNDRVIASLRAAGAP